MTSPITYRLPTSELVVTGSVRRRSDALAPADKQESWELAAIEVSVATVADTVSYPVTPPTGWFRTCKASFSVTNDGRLSAASSDSTGEVGAVLKSVASIAGGVAGFFALGLDDQPVDPAIAAYAAKRPAEAQRLQALKEARSQAQTVLVDALFNPDSDPAQVLRLRQRVALLDEQLVPLNALFQIWRDSQIETTTYPFEIRRPIAELSQVVPAVPKVNDENPTSAPETLDSLWTQYGYAITAHWLQGATDGKRTAPTKSDTITDDAHTVWTRTPEQVEVRVHQLRKGETVCITRSRHAVADAASQVVGYKLKKSWFAHKSTSLTFDTNGFVTTVATEGSSGTAAALSSLAGLPESFAGGVENATKAYTNVQAAGRASLEAENARLKDDVEKRQQELTKAGLDATAADAVELTRLTQLQGILDAQTAISGTDPSLVAGLAQRAGGDLDWYQPPPPAAPPEPTVVHVVFDQQGAGTTTPTGGSGKPDVV